MQKNSSKGVEKFHFLTLFYHPGDTMRIFHLFHAIHSHPPSNDTANDQVATASTGLLLHPESVAPTRPLVAEYAKFYRFCGQ